MTLADIPSAPGAYVLLLELARPLRLAIPSLPGSVLAPGRYAYCGSARGPGGLRARIARHLRHGKKLHWHVDRITAAARITAVLACPGGDECTLATRLLERPRVSVPVRGFGSSDCRRCAAHLLALPDAGDALALLRAVSVRAPKLSRGVARTIAPPGDTARRGELPFPPSFVMLGPGYGEGAV